MVIEYKVINEGPYLLEEPTTFVVERNTTSTYNIGVIEDKELDEFYLAEWTLATDE